MNYKRAKQVYVEYRDNVTATSPLEKRTYTMTHSDETGDLFVTIGLHYATDKVSPMRDEVYLLWQKIEGKDLLYGEVLIDGDGLQGNAAIRNNIFKKEMPLALQAIYTADEPLFEKYPHLKDTPVLINFKASDPTYNKLYSYGPIGNYNTSRKR